MHGHTFTVTALLIIGAVESIGAEDRRQLTVHLQNAQSVPFAILARAQSTAARIFVTIDIPIRWQNRPQPSGTGTLTAIALQFDTRVPPEFHPGALAYAAPYISSGTRIHVLLDRVLAGRSPDIAAVVLGHVLAHELAHVLQRSSRHSASGVMKARWTEADYAQMSFRPLSFEAEDMEWIHAASATSTARPYPTSM
jgi:hypothetical protein